MKDRMNSISELENRLASSLTDLGIKGKLETLRILDKAEYEDWKPMPEELRVRAHQFFIDGLTDYYLENIIKRSEEESEADAVRRIISWSFGKLAENYDSFLKSRGEESLSGLVSGYLEEALKLLEIQREEIRYDPKKNRHPSLVTPVLPKIRKREVEGGKLITLAWPHEEFLGRKVYAAKPHTDSPIRDVNRIKKHLRKMGSEVLESYTDENGRPAEIVLVPKLNLENREKFPKSKLINYSRFHRIVSEYEPEEIPAGIGNRVRTYWAIIPDKVMPTATTGKKKFYNLERTLEKKFRPDIDPLNLTKEADAFIIQYISNLLRNVADFYISGTKDRTIIHKLRHRYL